MRDRRPTRWVFAFLVTIAAAWAAVMPLPGLVEASGDRPDFIFAADIAYLPGTGESGHGILAVSELSVGVDGLQGPGAVHLFSMADGGVIRTIKGPSSGSLFGRSLDATVGMLAVGAPAESHRNQGHAILVSIRDGKTLLTIDGPKGSSGFGSKVHFIGDIDRDGQDDLAVGDPTHRVESQFPGVVTAFSTSTGKLMWHSIGTDNRQSSAGEIARPGDLNRDGSEDIVVGVVRPFGSMHPDEMVVASALTITEGRFIWRYSELAAKDHMTAGVSACRDVDGDGVRDLLIRSKVARPGESDRTMVKVVSGARGRAISEVTGPWKGAGWVSRAVEIGDVNSDGTPDLAVGLGELRGKGREVRSTVVAVCGKSNAQLFAVGGSEKVEDIGGRILACADETKDGIADFVVSGVTEKLQGKVLLVSGKDGTVVWERTGAE